MASWRWLPLALLPACATSYAATQLGAPSALRLRPVQLRRPPRLQVGEEPSTSVATGEVDLSAMSFDERLEYLAAQTANAVPVESLPEDEEGSMFGIDGDNPDTQWWKFEFWKLCFQDLSEMQWPTRKQTLQTVVTSQIAFVVLLVLILVLDALAESVMRSLLQGKDFGVTLDMVLKKSMQSKQ